MFYKSYLKEREGESERNAIDTASYKSVRL